MIHFAQGQYLFLIFLIPFFFLFYWLMLRGRKRRVAKFGDPSLVARLTPERSSRKGWVKLVFYSLAFFFFSIGMARPQIGATLKKQEVKGAEIMIALDVSNSMLAEDYYPNRLERAKLAISKLVDRLQDDRIGLVVFAGQSFVQLPITTDYVSAKIFLNSINTESIPVQGTALGDAILTCVRSFSMDSENSRAIILITDGENHEDDPISAAKDATTMGARVFCVGVGSSEGKPIPKDGELMKDKDGNIVVTRLDEQTLQDVARAGEGLYVRAGTTEFGLNPIIDEIKDMEAKRYQNVVFEEFDEQYMYFFGIALFFLLLEFMINSRRNKRKLFVAFLLLSTTAFGQVDKREVRAGNRAYKKGEFQQAEIDYRRGVLKDSTSIAAQYNLGNALYKMENFEEAAKHYSTVADTLADYKGDRSADYYHNVGNVALKQKKYQEAVDAFKESLRRNPADMETKSNLAYAQKKLEDQQNQQNQQNQDQNQDQNQQDQNEDQQNQDQQNDNQNQDQQNQQNQDQNNQDQNNQGQQPQITPQAAQQMLEAIQAKEKETQDKVKKAKAAALRSREREKNW